MQFTFYRCELANPSAPGQSDVRFKLKSRLQSAEGERRVTALSMEVFVRWMLPFGLAAIFVLAGVILDSNYRRSTPEPIYIQATVIDFERLHRKQVYPIFEFKDADGSLHRVVNPSQQAMVRFTTGDVVPIAYSRSDPQRARIDTFWFNHRWLMGGCLVALSLMFGALMRRQSSSWLSQLNRPRERKL